MEALFPLSHFRTGKPWKYWEAVGGKLVLTSHRLVFLAHRGQPWCYRLILPLEDIAGAEATASLGGIPGRLRVSTTSGKEELFTFGALRELEGDRWAAAILRARYHLNPSPGK